MQEINLFVAKEKLEKKFYRTKSESHRLKDLKTTIATLQKGKQMLVDEFKEKQRKSKNQPFDKKVFRGIYNELIDKNKLIKEKRDIYIENKRRLKKDIEVKKGAQKINKETHVFKEEDINACEKRIKQELNVNFQLHTKLSCITNDVEIIRDRIINLAEMAQISKVQLKKILDLRVIGDFKKIFSNNLLKQKRKNLKKIVKTSEDNFGKQNRLYQKNKNSISKLFDQCAWQNMELKEKQKKHKEVLLEIKEIGTGKEEQEKLDNIRQTVSVCYQKLKMVTEKVENSYIIDVDLKTEIKRNGGFIGLVDNILVYFSDLNFSINQGYKTIDVLNGQKEKSRGILSDMELGYNTLKINSKSHNKAEDMEHCIENSNLFISTRESINFLFRSKSFIFSFGSRIKRMVDTINQICELLDFNTVIDTNKIPERSSLLMGKGGKSEVKPKQLNKTMLSGELYAIIINKEQKEMLDSCFVINEWIEKSFPEFGQFNTKNKYSTHIMSFFESILSYYDNFTLFSKGIMKEIRGELKLKKQEENIEDHKYTVNTLNTKGVKRNLMPRKSFMSNKARKEANFKRAESQFAMKPISVISKENNKSKV